MSQVTSVRPLLFAVAIALTLVAFVAIAPPEAVAKACGEVKVKHTRLSVGGSSGVGCDFQRRWTKRFLRGGNEPSGWSCRLTSSTSGGCDKRRGSQFFVFYPVD